MALGRKLCLALAAGIFLADVSGLKSTDHDLLSRQLTEQRTVLAATWNTHTQCFNECREPNQARCDPGYPHCQNKARETVSAFLANGTYDFIGLQLFTDRALFAAGMVDGWSHIEHLCGGVGGYGVYPFDVARLIYNSRRWEAVGDASGGCLEIKGDGAAHTAPLAGTQNNYRAFLVQALRRRGTEEKIAVAVAHFPHRSSGDFERKMSPLKEVIANVSAQSGALRTLLIADTNFGTPPEGDADIPESYNFTPASSEQVARYLSSEPREVTGTDLAQDTCCSPQYWGGSLDRIIAVNFTEASMVTELPFGEGQHVPFASHFMHDPVVGRLTYEAPITADLAA